MSENTKIALKEFIGFLLRDIGAALVLSSAKNRENFYCDCDDEDDDDSPENLF